MKTLNVLIVDGQGGGIGRQLVEEIKNSRLPCRVTAVGTNTAATAAMQINRFIYSNHSGPTMRPQR